MGFSKPTFIGPYDHIYNLEKKKRHFAAVYCKLYLFLVFSFFSRAASRQNLSSTSLVQPKNPLKTTSIYYIVRFGTLVKCVKYHPEIINIIGMETFCGHFFSKWANSSGHFLRVNSCQHVWWILVDKNVHENSYFGMNFRRHILGEF